MRVGALALALAAVVSCHRGSLQPDAGGPGMLSFDAAAGDGTGIGGDGGPGPSDVLPPTPDHNCGASSIGGGYLAPQILVVLDETVTGDRTKWADVIRVLSNLVVDHDAGIDWGLYRFSRSGPVCDPQTVTSTIDVPISPMNAAAVAAAIRTSSTDGAGSATGAAIEIGGGYLDTLPADRPKFMLLVTDHTPTCAGAPEKLRSDATEAQTDAVYLIAAAAAEGIPTMVLAPSTTSDVDALNALALAGGRPRATSGVAFNTEQTLADQFMTDPVTVNCVFPLASAPPVPTNVEVTFNGLPVPRDALHMSGWDYTDPPTNGTIQFFGDWCAQVIDSRSWQIRALYGCP